MKRKYYIFLLSLSFIVFLPVLGEDHLKLEIIYPKNNSNINASSVFIVGNTSPKAKLTVNDFNVKIYPNGGFVYIVNLSKGNNKIKIRSCLNNDEKTIFYFLNVPKNKDSTPLPDLLNINPSIYAEVLTDYAKVRAAPDKSRLTPLPKGTKLNITGKIGNNYRFKMGETQEGWISGDDIKNLSSEANINQNTIGSINVESNPDYILFKIPVSEKLPINIQTVSGSRIILDIYNTVADIDSIPYLPDDAFIKEVKWFQTEKNTVRLIIESNSSHLWGYKYYYENNLLVLAIRKPPKIDKKHPLKDKIITLDPGHGGSESGSVGPTGIPEKTINLAIAKYLRKYLEKSGVKVIMTRENDDQSVGLYERVDIAQKNNSLILLSIHNNALPDGGNPYQEHGSSSYYYHSQSLPLARYLQKSMIKKLKLKDNGIYWESLALTRPNEPLSVLVEVGFMINPEEYMMLSDSHFQKKAAKALYLGLEDFFRNETIKGQQKK